VVVTLILVILLALVLLNAWATWRILQDDLSSLGQRVAQTAFVWLIPFVGGSLAIYLKRRDLESHLGAYPEPRYPGDDFGGSGAGYRHTTNALESDTATSDGAASSD
jgi:hypothetical protein